MILLAIDTAANLGAASIHDTAGGHELGRAVHDIGSGHAEQLMPVIGEALAAAGKQLSDIGRVVVSTGPGSFTGIRVGVSAARGFALALKIPAVGVTTLEALAEACRPQADGRPVLVVLDAGRGEFHAALYDGLGKLRYGPAMTSLSTLADIAREQRPLLAGSAARQVAEATGGGLDIGAEAATADIAVYARLGTGKDAAAGRPKPTYLRGADAKPQAGFVLPRL
ncbi:MAG: tRNA (adenosine(37)-N6)-threonylcarbamoyltransferase complex dimerization subunit type 1 TsaB [Rhizobiaceae bacterium]|nr:tRNA (adenosine(37)-N6)-threonylcarbamoyltransferase complex dimerization subunit type 1 TsaB [Rhizobiaceae bacterium]